MTVSPKQPPPDSPGSSAFLIVSQANLKDMQPGPTITEPCATVPQSIPEGTGTGVKLLHLPWQLPLLVLVIAEAAILAVVFDPGRLWSAAEHWTDASWWQDLWAQNEKIPWLAARLLVPIAIAWLLFARRTPGHSPYSYPASQSSGRFVVWITVHLVTYITFVATGYAAFDQHSPFRAPNFALSVCLAVLGLVSLGSLLVASDAHHILGRSWRLGAGAFVAATAVGVAAWGAGRLSQHLWHPLSESTFHVVEVLLRPFLTETICEPERLVIGSPGFRITLVEGCSGFDGIGLVCVFLIAYLWFFREFLRFPQSLLLLPIGLVLIWCVNALRIAALVLIGSWGSAELALGGFHSQAGWLAFNGVGLGLVLVSSNSRLLRREGATPTDERPRSAAVPYLMPLFATLLIGMLSSAIDQDGEQLYPLGVVVAAYVLWLYRKRIPEFGWHWSWTPLAAGFLTALIWAGAIWLDGSSDVASRPSMFDNESSALVAFRLTFRWIGFIFVTPLVEELAFRGYLTRRLIAADFTSVPPGMITWVSFVISSLIFGLLHGHWLLGTLAGMVYAITYAWRGRLMEAVVAHVVTNAALAIASTTLGEPRFWS
jgi:exosortase E/protease (VPEID-CTERM system)